MEKDKTALRDGLIAELWRMNKMDIILHLREFVEGETAALWFLRSCAFADQRKPQRQPRARGKYPALPAAEGLCRDGDRLFRQA